MQSEHLGYLSRGIAPHDIGLYPLHENVSSTNLRKTADLRVIFSEFSNDLQDAGH